MSSGCELFCFPCSQRFDSQDELSSHLHDHLQDKLSSSYMKFVEPFICQKCSKSFANRSELYKHYAGHYLQSHFTCKNCGFICMNVSLLTMHELSCKQVNIVKISNTNRENESDNFNRETLNQFCMSSYGTWKVVNPVNFNNVTSCEEGLLCSSTRGDRDADSEELIAQNDSYDIRAKIHVCDVCSESFSRRCVLDVHRQKHVNCEESEQHHIFRENKLSQISWENEMKEIACKNLQLQKVNNAAEENKQPESDHESKGNPRNTRKPSKRVRRKINSPERKPLTVIDPCSSSGVNKGPSKAVGKRNPAKNTRLKSVKKSRKMRRKFPIRKPYNLRSHLTTCQVTRVKESLQSSQKASGSLQSSQKASGSLQSSQKASGSLQSSQKASGSLQSSQEAPGSLQSSQKSSGSLQSPQKSSGSLQSSQKSPGSLQSPQETPMSMQTALKTPENLHSTEKTSGRLQNAHKASGSLQNTHKTPENLQNSHKTSRGNRLVTCNVCYKLFKDKSKLRRHSLIHTGERPFACLKCNRRFSRKDHLNRHFIISCNYGNAVRPFPCDKCNKAFKVKWGLFKHSFVHTRNKPFKCDKCTKSFSEKYRLVRHMSLVKH